jgi:hypothetical protein
VLFCRSSTGGCVRVTRFFLGGASALAVRVAGLTLARSSLGADWAFGIAERTRSDAMSGAGAGAVLRFRIASGCVEWACHGFGRPTRSPVTIGGELGSSVASANEQQRNQCQTYRCKKGESWHRHEIASSV